MQVDTTQPVLAVFDFDGTLTNRHTFWRYIRFIHGPYFFWVNIFFLSPLIFTVLLGIIPIMQARRKFIHHFLSGIDIEIEKAMAKYYVNEYLPLYLRPQALRRLDWHQSQGHLVALVSNSPENYLKIWGKQINFDIVCGTRLGIHGKKLSGDVVGRDCVGEEKVRRLREILPDLDRYQIYVYGDSSGDYPMLSIATFPFYRNWY